MNVPMDYSMTMQIGDCINQLLRYGLRNLEAQGAASLFKNVTERWATVKRHHNKMLPTIIVVILEVIDERHNVGVRCLRQFR